MSLQQFFEAEFVNDDQMTENENMEPSRRRFLKAAAGVGVAGAVWSEPIIRGIPVYAADAASVFGMVSNLTIRWSPNRDNWDTPATQANLTQVLNQSPNICMGVPATDNNTYNVTLNTGVMITLMGVGNPDVGGTGTSMDRSCANGTSPGILSLEPQTGCMFHSVSATNGSGTVQSSGTQIRWINNASGGGVQTLTFSIQCG